MANSSGKTEGVKLTFKGEELYTAAKDESYVESFRRGEISKEAAAILITSDFKLFLLTKEAIGSIPAEKVGTTQTDQGINTVLRVADFEFQVPENAGAYTEPFCRRVRNTIGKLVKR